MELEAHCLWFECRALTDIAVPAYKGSTIRGALFASLRRDFCLDQRGPYCSDSRVRQSCPVCALLATVDDSGRRGLEVARPCTVEPPLDDRNTYHAGEVFGFGVTLFGQAAELLPYVVIGVRRMGETGIGDRRRAGGRFAIASIQTLDPIGGRSQQIYREDQALVRRPDSPVTHQSILVHCASLNSVRAVTLDLLTPMRLTPGARLVKQIDFPTFVRRLLRRLTDLCQTAAGKHPGFDHRPLLEQAETITVVEDRTQWKDVASYSSRQGRSTPIGGLVGSITFAGELQPFVPWLVWGSITHVGKNATKGDGWYRLRWQS